MPSHDSSRTFAKSVLVAGLAGCTTEADESLAVHPAKHGRRLEQRVGGQVGTEPEGPQQRRCTRSDVAVAASQVPEVAAVGWPHQPLAVLDGSSEPLSGHLSPDPVPHLVVGDVGSSRIRASSANKATLSLVASAI